MTCKHHYIRTWVFEDTGQPSGLWSCVDCSLKFEPITQRTAAKGDDTKAWVGLTEQERNDMEDFCEMIIGKAAFDAIEAKLKQKNGYAEE